LTVPAQASPSSPAAAAGTSCANPTPPAVPASPATVQTADSVGTKPLSTVGSSDASADPPIVAITEVEENQESSQEAFENVHATVVIENCPTENCDYKVVYDLVTKEHN
jgi:hypothetical protein